MMDDASIFIAEVLLPFSPSFISSQDSIANGTLVIARLQLVTGIRPVGRPGRPITLPHATGPASVTSQ